MIEIRSCERKMREFRGELNRYVTIEGACNGFRSPPLTPTLCQRERVLERFDRVPLLFSPSDYAPSPSGGGLGGGEAPEQPHRYK